MSDTDNVPAKTPGEPLAAQPDFRPPRHGCLTALMVVVGIIFLLPGVCVLAVTKGLHSDPLFGVIAIIAFVVGIGGIGLIRLALRGQRR